MLSLEDNSDHFTDICLKVIEELLKLQKFYEAEQLAELCDLSKDRIHLAPIARQIEILRINNDFEEILEFWKKSHNDDEENLKNLWSFLLQFIMYYKKV